MLSNFFLSSFKMPPVGKSGPLINFNNSLTEHPGLLFKCMRASQTSFTLCGGIEVAIPTAIPEDPLAKIFGNCEGKISGSSSSPSYVF